MEEDKHDKHEGHSHEHKKSHEEHHAKHDSHHEKKHEAHHAKKHEGHEKSHHESHAKKHAATHHSAKKKKKTSYTKYVVGALVFIAVIAFIWSRAGQPGPVDVDDPEQYGSVDVTFYVMSQCPYGIQVENAIEPVLDELGENIDFRLEYIAAEAGTGFQSLHGQPEVEGNIVQLCVQEHYPEDLIDFVVCQNKDPRDLVGSIDECSEGTSIDVERLKTCSEGGEGKDLLRTSIKASQAVNAQGSPTIYIDDKQYSGARDATSFKRTICQGLEGHPLCEELPACGSDMDCIGEPGKVGICENPGKKDAVCTYRDDELIELTIVNAAECSSCDTTQLKGLLSQIFLNMKIEEIDASSSKGKAFIKNLALQNAPAYVFKGDLTKTYAWQTNERIRGAFRPDDSGNFFVMLDDASGATYILDEKKRAEFEKLTGVTKGDNRPQIDFYVMSYCPYGNIAEEAIEPAYQLLKDSADFNPHYVIYSNYQGGGPKFCLDDEDKYCSMHGVQELNQGLRELCVAKHFGMDEYFEFTLEMNEKCNYNNADECWEPVAKKLGYNVERIKSCEANAWEDILSKELALNQALGVRGSPTVFVEGAAYNGARAASGYAQSLCAGFESMPDECSTESLASLGASAPASDTPAGSC